MTIYYCHRCAAQLGYLNNVYTSDPLQSQYQLDKFMKHTIPPFHPFASIFPSTSTSEYAHYVVETDNVVETGNSGVVEIDGYGRRNIIWVAGRPTGFTCRDGVLVGPTDGVKMVLSSEATRIHAYPVNTTTLTTQVCASCSGLVST